MIKKKLFTDEPQAIKHINKMTPHPEYFSSKKN